MAAVTAPAPERRHTSLLRDYLGDYIAHPQHGPLPGLLLLLTVATGAVDAVSILALGRVFIANMTGNVVFTGFAVAGAPGFSLAAALLALAGFVAGAGVGGAVVRRIPRRGRLLAVGTTAELGLLLAALAVALPSAEPFGAAPRDVITVLAAIALGIQNAVVRSLAVPDATTTVLTMTLTGFAADLRDRNWRVVLRRALAVLAMLLGGLVGALAVLRVGAGPALLVATGLVAVVASGSWGAARSSAAWQTSRS
jgi:uncharacterized membrane protein YoaK (UPF0700 family)